MIEHQVFIDRVMVIQH